MLVAPRYRCAMLAQPEAQAPTSSLTFMLARFAERWDPQGETHFFVRDGNLDVAGVTDAVRGACEAQVPVALLGTTFAFVHLADHLDAAAQTLRLPPGSVVMPTGGSKGRAREMRDDELRALLARVLDVRPAQVVGEYGMTELSSQASPTRCEARGRRRSPSRCSGPPSRSFTSPITSTRSRRAFGSRRAAW